MKNLYLFIIAFTLCISGYSQCITNGNFEAGAAGINAFNYTLNADNDPNNSFFISSCEVDTDGFFSINATQIMNQTNATLVQAGNDPTTGIPMVHNGNFAMKLNDNDGEAEITTMSQIFTPQAGTISFFYSLIVEVAHPGTPQQAFFSTRIYDVATGNIINNNNICIEANTNNPIFSNSNGLLTTDWRCGMIGIPDEYIGHEVRLEFIITDCGAGAHSGTVYIDDITCGINCNNPAFGFLQLNPTQNNCPNQPFTVCGNFILPDRCNTSPDLILEIIKDGETIASLTNAQINGNTFCFTVDPSNFGANPNGGYEFNLTGNFTLDNGFVLTLFDSSSVPGSDVSFGVSPEDATVNGNILSWPDVSSSYTLEFVADGTCCPGQPAPSSPISYTVTTTVNQFDLDLVINELSYKCFRWRILTDCGGWSDWCCLASSSDTYENLLHDVCYPEGLELCLPNYHAVITENGYSFEQREQWITAENTIQSNAEVTYQAGDYVELQPGFNTVTGTTFLAQIEGCVPELTVTTTSAKMVYEEEFDDNQIRESYNGFTVYPNPTSGTITVQFETNVNEFSVYDIT